jgi:phosphatidylethanolamine-binding protein (PEBP) family uncharacterized protein
MLSCEDPDAPGGTVVHWLLTGIDLAVTDVAEGAEVLSGTAAATTRTAASSGCTASTSASAGTRMPTPDRSAKR